jgi:arylsulfatase A-like enzyme
MQVILIVSDTLRADHLGCHGYFRATSPHIDRFAAEGVRFATHTSQAPYTLPSFTSLITGQFGTTHKYLPTRLARTITSPSPSTTARRCWPTCSARPATRCASSTDAIPMVAR